MKKEAVKEATKAALEEKKNEDSRASDVNTKETEEELRKRIEAEVAERMRKEFEAKATAEKIGETDGVSGDAQTDAEQTKKEEK